MSRSSWTRRGAAVGALVIAGLVGGIASQAFAGGQTFVDVSPSNQFFDDIEFMAATGIAGGYNDNTYRPGAPVTRQAMAAFIHRAQTYTYVEASGQTDSTVVTATATCPANQIAVGGGVATSNSEMFVTDSRPSVDRTQWFGRVESDDNVPIPDMTIYVTAICVPGEAVDAF
jgi:hypothetical protein